MRNKDYCPRPNTLLYRQIKEILELEIRNLAKNINRDEFVTKWIEKRKKDNSNVDIESKISKLEARKDKLYQSTKKIYDEALNEIFDSETLSKTIKVNQGEQKKKVGEIETLKVIKK